MSQLLKRQLDEMASQNMSVQPKHTTTLALRPHATDAPPLHQRPDISRPQWKLPAVPQSHPFFKSLPPAIQVQVLSYLPLKSVEASRRTCKELCSIIDASEDKLAQLVIEFHLNRLQAAIDVINAAQMPTDVETVLASMRIWTSTRGNFFSKSPSLESRHKWFAYLAGDPVRTPRNLQTRQKFEQWAHVARVATKIQLSVNDAAVNNAPVATWESIYREFSLHPSPLNDESLYQLYARIRDAGDLHGPIISGLWHHVKEERRTFPDTSRSRYHLTPLRPRISYNPHRLVPPLAPPHVRSDPISYFLPLSPTQEAGLMLGPQGLPTLPLHDTFCYYVTSKKVLKALFEKKAITPWVRAAILERVELC